MTAKRSLSIRGHRTSISIEEPFWSELKAMASRKALSVPLLIAEIDAGRDPQTNLSSAIRLAVLADVLGRVPSASS